MSFHVFSQRPCEGGPSAGQLPFGEGGKFLDVYPNMSCLEVGSGYGDGNWLDVGL